MSEIIGRELEVGVSVEQTRGTPQSTAEKWMKNVTVNIVAKSEKAIDDNSHNVLEDSDGSRVTKKWYEGDLEGIVHADPIGYFFYNLYGAVVSTWLSASVYSHVFNITQTIIHASLALFIKDGSVQQKVLSNGMLNTLEISATIDDYVRFTAGFIAKDEASNSDSPSYTTERDFIGKDIEIKLADTAGGISGATATKIKDLTITLDQGAIIDHVLGTYNPDDIYNAKMSVEIKFTKNFIDETFEDLWGGDDAKYVQIAITGAEDIGGGNNPSITLLLNKAQVTDWNRSGANDELVTEEVTMKAFYNETDDKQSQLTLVNNTSEYDDAPSV